MQDIKILAILIGVVTDVGSTQVIMMRFVIFYTISHRLHPQAAHDLFTNPPLSIRLPEMALGALGSFLGGFVTGRLAKTEEIKNTLLMGLLSDITAALLPGAEETWVFIVGSFLTVCAAMTGGYLARVIADEDRKPNAS
jgi:NADH:ubiquinone oxidoreductase subunit 5 (subunit L)/multisubunit Na+/H+ antiporter MnhA subunit